MIIPKNCWLFPRPRNVTRATASLPYKVFEKAVKSALQKVNIGNISSLMQPQSRALFTFLCGNDTFVSLPTGHGKSLIYQICPVVAKELSHLEEQFPAEPMLFVVSSLISDQINSGERMGINACKVDSESTISLQKRCDYQLLYDYHRFPWYATLENKTPAETFPKFLSVLRVTDRSDRNSPITATSVTFRPSLRHASGLWLVDFDPICR